MLDDLKMIHERDKSDALHVAQNLAQQLTYEFVLDLMPPKEPIQNIVLAGMGGSALAAQVALSWPGFSVPFTICRDYNIPDFVGSNTLFIASSYSGNTEEVLSALAEAESRNAGIVVMASGGKLTDIASQKNYPYLALPTGYQPRHTTLYMLKALLTFTDALGVTDNSVAQLASEAEWLHDQLQSWGPTIPTDKNLAKQLALEMIGKSVVIYSGPKLWPAAYKWKISFNENAKHIAWANQFSEYNHNEIIGWTKQPTEKPYAVVELRSHLEHPQIQKRFEVSERILSGSRPALEIVAVQGDTLLRQLVWAMALGEHVSIYSALLANIDPTPVELLEKLKTELAQ